MSSQGLQPPTQRRTTPRGRKLTIAAAAVAAVLLVAGIAYVIVLSLSPNTCACPASIFFHAVYGSNQTLEGVHVYSLGFIHDWPASLTVSEIRFSIVNATCAPVSGVRTYILSYANGTVFAVENGTTEQWSSGSMVILPVDPAGPGMAGNLTIRSAVDLSSDRLASAQVPGGIQDLSALRPGYVPGTGIGSGWECNPPS